ncbi:MAG TPA: hypothetical protein VFD35_06910 [Pricia sp.]|nr:hypothetical protein [Pricia sp.]
MKNYLLLYYAPESAIEKMGTASKEEKEAGMKQWMDWKSKNEENVIDFGAPMMGAYRIEADGSESRKQSTITGYSLIQANDRDHAESLVKDHPHLDWTPECAIEVFECIPMG